VVSTLPNFAPQIAQAEDNCTAALYGISDSVSGSSASSSTTAVEVGVKFTPAFDTTATAVRFYRSVADSAGYDVHLWDSDGTLLGSGSDSGATGTGWIEIDLDDPVSLTAGTTYVSSYRAAHGRQQIGADAYQTPESNTMLSTPPDAGSYVYDTGATGAINPSADTYVDSNHTSSNYGATNPLWATLSSTRAFLRFSTSSAVPAGATVTGAKLKIYVTQQLRDERGLRSPPGARYLDGNRDDLEQPTNLGLNRFGNIHHSDVG